MNRTHRSALISAAMLGLFASRAYALQIPASCGDDAHVQCASYDTNQVYRVVTTAGCATLIQFEPGEKIDVPATGLGLGDAQAWKVGAAGNWILLKPSAVRPDTNLVVVTSLRRYSFSLVTAKKGEAVTWVLSFDYPDSLRRRAAEAAKKHVEMQAALARDAAPCARANTAYFMQGDAALAPTAAWDDGRFTCFQFKTSRDVPGIFSVLPDGSEATVNTHVVGDTVVVEETDKNFMLRLGQSVLGVRNDGYSPDGQFNRTGTTLDNTVRLVKEH